MRFGAMLEESMETEETRVRELGNDIVKAASAIDRTEHQLLSLLREYDSSHGWSLDGATSFPVWLSWRCGMSRGAARERIRVSKALGELPLIDAAFGAGEISYSKARAVTRVATPENEETLLASARGMTASELEKLCRMLRAAGLETDAPAEPQRRFSQQVLADGMVRISLTLPADEAGVVCVALDAAAPSPNRRCEGLVELADQVTRGTHALRNPTEVLLHIEASDLSGFTDEGAGVSAETSRRLLCDAGVVPVLCDETGKTLDVGRKTRTIPSAIRRALSRRDDGCQFPGCDHQIVDGHHILHWASGGETKLENLVSVCRVHHGFVHEGRFSVSIGPGGKPEFRSPSGKVLVAAPPPAPPGPVAAGDPWIAMATDEVRPLDWQSITEAFAV